MDGRFHKGATEKGIEVFDPISFIAVKAYMALMTAIIDEFKLDKHDPKIKMRMEYARMVAWTDGEEQASQLRNELGLE